MCLKFKRVERDSDLWCEISGICLDFEMSNFEWEKGENFALKGINKERNELILISLNEKIKIIRGKDCREEKKEREEEEKRKKKERRKRE
jgi:hypothetical protein